jgi:hypothetical protein
MQSAEVYDQHVRFIGNKKAGVAAGFLPIPQDHGFLSR